MKPESTKDQRISNPIDNPRFMSLKEAARRTGLSVWVLRQAVLKGDVGFIQFAPQGKIWLTSDDLTAFQELIYKRYRQTMK